MLPTALSARAQLAALLHVPLDTLTPDHATKIGDSIAHLLSRADRETAQYILQVGEDGVIGNFTRRALALLLALEPNSAWPPGSPADPHPETGFHHVTASSFADPRDVNRFRQCKATGKSDQQCFAVGDNGLGFGIYDCTAGSGPSCALPPEDWLARWGSRDNTVNKLVRVRIAGRADVICRQRDTMPHKGNIQNGAGIDLNPDAVAALGQKIPLMTPAGWIWEDDYQAMQAEQASTATA